MSIVGTLERRRRSCSRSSPRSARASAGRGRVRKVVGGRGRESARRTYHLRDVGVVLLVELVVVLLLVELDDRLHHGCLAFLRLLAFHSLGVARGPGRPGAGAPAPAVGGRIVRVARGRRAFAGLARHRVRGTRACSRGLNNLSQIRFFLRGFGTSFIERSLKGCERFTIGLTLNSHPEPDQKPRHAGGFCGMRVKTLTRSRVERDDAPDRAPPSRGS